MMDDYMVAIINGGIDDGKIDYLGHNFCFSYHGECLINYASLKYPHISGFSKLDYMKEPNGPIYYLSLLDNIIFTNISVDGEKRGVLYFTIASQYRYCFYVKSAILMHVTIMSSFCRYSDTSQKY